MPKHRQEVERIKEERRRREEERQRREEEFSQWMKEHIVEAGEKVIAFLEMNPEFFYTQEELLWEVFEKNVCDPTAASSPDHFWECDSCKYLYLLSLNLDSLRHFEWILGEELEDGVWFGTNEQKSYQDWKNKRDNLPLESTQGM